MPDKKERACRICGCTENNACPGGCAWVAKDLCSACANDIPWGNRKLTPPQLRALGAAADKGCALEGSRRVNNNSFRRMVRRMVEEGLLQEKGPRARGRFGITRRGRRGLKHGFV